MKKISKYLSPDLPASTRYLARSAAFTAALFLPMLLSLPSHAGNLYSWTGADGTPTYSPSAPPAGTVYEIVGADLKPIKRYQKPELATSANGGSLVDLSNAVNEAAAEQKKQSTYSPVVYTSDPNAESTKHRATAASQKTTARTPAPTGVTTTTTASSSATPTPTTPALIVTPECLALRRDIILLENQFATAPSYEAMDQAILDLQARNQELGDICS